ncbi:MAG: hypothetical protein VX250_09265 [Planctomycetota bacterium]|nr:hypothetical protein [Planctomycetota bacterium]
MMTISIRIEMRLKRVPAAAGPARAGVCREGTGFAGRSFTREQLLLPVTAG